MKLLGIGTACACVGIAHSQNPDVALSCALSAGVAIVACAHYWFIWAIRAQSFGTPPYSSWMVGVGRTDAGYAAELASNAHKLYAQETSVDGWRYSDWTVRYAYSHTNPPALGRFPLTHFAMFCACSQFSAQCTLVLMTLELGNLAAHASPDRTPWVSAPINAGLQPVIIGLGTIGRFFANEIRRDADGRWPAAGTPGWWGLAFGVLGYLASFGVWLFTTLNLLAQVGPLDGIADDQRRNDGTAVYAICLVQIGYPLVALVQVVWLNFFAKDLRDQTGLKPMPGNQYSPWLSFLKDLAFSALDITTKGGLCFYVVLRTGWIAPVTRAVTVVT